MYLQSLKKAVSIKKVQQLYNQGLRLRLSPWYNKRSKVQNR